MGIVRRECSGPAAIGVPCGQQRVRMTEQATHVSSGGRAGHEAGMIRLLELTYAGLSGVHGVIASPW